MSIVEEFNEVVGRRSEIRVFAGICLRFIDIVEIRLEATCGMYKF
jgi:hypothetical protein